MNIALWIVQALLALAFFAAGMMKLTTPYGALLDAGLGGWVTDASPLLIKFIGLSEFLGAVGLILPWATGIQRWLTPAAAVGLVTVMVLAAGTHASYGELGEVVPNLVLGALAAFVAWGRFTRAAEPVAAATA